MFVYTLKTKFNLCFVVAKLSKSYLTLRIEEQQFAPSDLDELINFLKEMKEHFPPVTEIVEVRTDGKKEGVAPEW